MFISAARYENLVDRVVALEAERYHATIHTDTLKCRVEVLENARSVGMPFWKAVLAHLGLEQKYVDTAPPHLELVILKKKRKGKK